jgi:CoA-transferase family III
LRLDGESVGPGFAPLSTWLRTADGWLRSHANYPHHRRALLAALGVGDDREAVRAAAAHRAGEDLEDAIVAAGGAAAMLRDPNTWAAHPQGRAVAGLGLLDLDEGAGREMRPLAALASAALAASGVRVLDLTRVIAGPVAGRTLAALGADVLRIDAPDAIELDGSTLDGGPGKRWARIDLRTAGGARTLDALLADADVLITGYRPGALDRLGFGVADVARRHPHVVTASLSAWGATGPWGTRRGFDSLVQAASGIAATCTEPDAAIPGALPAQALDHGTGHLIAAAVLRGLAHRTRTGRPLHGRFALARTAAWLLAQPRPGSTPEPAPVPPPDPTPFLLKLRYGTSTLTVVRPPGSLDGVPLRWNAAVVPIDRASWR